MKNDDFKKSEYYQNLLENFEIIYREAYDKGWNDALAKVQDLLPKQDTNGK